jgi:hypothetical protein
LSVHEGIRLQKHEDDGIREAGEQGEDKHDRFRDEHAEGTDPSDENLVYTEALLECFELVGSPDIVWPTTLFAFCKELPSDAVQKDCFMGFGDESGMGNLDGATTATHDRTTDGGEDDESYSISFIITDIVSMKTKETGKVLTVPTYQPPWQELRKHLQ